MTIEQETIYWLVDKYNSLTEPLESWETADIVEMIRVLDSELQQRYAAASSGLTTNDYEEDDDDERYW